MTCPGRALRCGGDDDGADDCSTVRSKGGDGVVDGDDDGADDCSTVGARVATVLRAVPTD
jgi:hypothetical protein